MKTVTPGLQAMFNSRQFSTAKLFTFTYSDGTVERYCTGDRDLTVSGLVYSCGGQTGPYFEQSGNKAKTSLRIGVDVGQLSFDVIPKDGKAYNGIPFLTAALWGVFDGADVLYQRAYIGSDGSIETLFMFHGRVGAITPGRSLVSFTVNSYTELLNQNLPIDLYQAGCNNTLFDANCGIGQPQALANLLTFTRASTGSYINSAGLLAQAAINQPRFYYDPVTLVAKGVLLEGARINICAHSQLIGNTTNWNVPNVTATLNSAVAPDGTSTASLLTSNNGGACRSSHTIGPTNGLVYTASAFLHAGNANGYLSFDDGGGNVTAYVKATLTGSGSVTTGGSSGTATATIQKFSGGWYRVTLTDTAVAATDTFLSIGVWGGGADSSNYPGATAGGNTVYAWGAQLELGSFASSYIPTTSGGVARSPDVNEIIDATIKAALASGSGTILIETDQVNGETSSEYFINGQGGDGIAPQGSKTVVGQYNGSTAVNSSAQDVSANTVRTVFGWSSGGRSIIATGGAVVTDGNPIGAASSHVYLGSSAGARSIFGYLRRVCVWNYRLTDSDLASLAAFGTPKFMIGDLDFVNQLFSSNRFVSAGVVGAGSTASMLLTSLPQAASYYDLGKVIFTSGALKGFARSVRSWAPAAMGLGTLRLSTPFPTAPAPGDTFNVYAGCDKQQVTCAGKFSNIANYRGTPYVPAPETAA